MVVTKHGCHCRTRSDGIVPAEQTESDEPILLQRIKHEGSVLSLAISDDYIFAGTQRHKIVVCQVQVEVDCRYGIFIRMRGRRP